MMGVEASQPLCGHQRLRSSYHLCSATQRVEEFEHTMVAFIRSYEITFHGDTEMKMSVLHLLLLTVELLPPQAQPKFQRMISLNIVFIKSRFSTYKFFGVRLLFGKQLMNLLFGPN